jgi:hypothetical protein
VRDNEDWKILRVYEQELNEKDEGRLPRYQGSPFVGLRNEHGWLLQGFIEDAEGRLRLQTREEHLFCMGCHTNVGVTVDQTFAFPRKVPAREGWRYQDVRGIVDVPQIGHIAPETLTYLERVRGGDELRQNGEMLERFFEKGGVIAEQVRRAAAGGDRDLAFLILPSRERALSLNKASMVVAREQRYEKGRDPVIAPARNVHRRIDDESTGLAENRAVFPDGQLRLAWPSTSNAASGTKRRSTPIARAD